MKRSLQEQNVDMEDMRIVAERSLQMVWAANEQTRRIRCVAHERDLLCLLEERARNIGAKHNIRNI